jgi:putative addiction module CopG family antidote
MSLQLSPDLLQLVNAQIASGEFATVDEVLRAALDSLVERQEVVEDLQGSLADIEAGRVMPLDDVIADIRQRHGWALMSA